MFSTVIFASIILGLIIVWVVLWALFLRLGLYWAKVTPVTLSRVVLTLLIVIVLQVSINILLLSFLSSTDDQWIFTDFIAWVMAVVVPCVVISVVFKVRFLRAFQAWLPTLLATLTTVVLTLFVLRPLLYEAYIVPTNGMAPTLLGQHLKGTCPECGNPAYGSPPDDRYETVDPSLMICESFHVSKASNVGQSVRSGDHFFVAKFLKPRRWDAIVFHNPEEPTVMNVMRIVGLPGEKIHIQDGFVWVDGIRQAPPESIRGIEYLSEISYWTSFGLWGSAERPAQLGDGEYFVLGDFSAQSMDSRFWREGAPGCNPFAVPESYIEGVVTHTYWPPGRWRIHR